MPSSRMGSSGACVYDRILQLVRVLMVWFGVDSHAKPFRCVICPRSSRAVELVGREYAEVEGDLGG